MLNMQSMQSAEINSNTTDFLRKSTKTILLVDDEMIFLKSLAEGLRMLNNNYNIMIASDGEQAIMTMKFIRTDLLVTDLKMPVMDGFDLLIEVLKKYPELPVIVTSAFSNANVINKINAMGFSHFIEKPFEFDDLADMISLLLPTGADSSNIFANRANKSESRAQIM